MVFPTTSLTTNSPTPLGRLPYSHVSSPYSIPATNNDITPEQLHAMGHSGEAIAKLKEHLSHNKGGYQVV